MKNEMRSLAILVTIGMVACGSDSEPAADAGQAGNDAAPDTEIPGMPDGRASDATGPTCREAAEQLLLPIDSVSTGDVVILSEGSQGAKTIYVDATAGGVQMQAMNPRLYLSLETAKRVDVTDRTAATSAAWDLAIKRPILFTNGGDGGSGQGGAVFLADRDFASVTTSDVASAMFARESFFEADCTPKLDQTNAVRTTFSDWYDYDPSSNGVSPKAGTWLIRGGSGKVYKFRVISFYATPDGGVGTAGGRYTLEISAL
jgi:hypothetical protein